ncbi:LysM peptidoglycan-binding domain-containing protein [Thalassoglobus polymorphus]|uniref:LysM domain/BON superfamily protein n=1 Tax=Thalassoglobus polymorphus TaxID=2527994 RepID=A0A517QRQ4_9PLAN|nr:LysM peptidoglycan-binding domain-containing protein [Thalassoglobus polymorphus]QDT34295.1 LysM domain/BON superfamily protein [Thalassoglobus polymorphus]
MRSDAKLGLALGMLVIGFAIAFCFPRGGFVQPSARSDSHPQQDEHQHADFVQIRTLREEGTQRDGKKSLAQLNQPSQKKNVLPSVRKSETIAIETNNAQNSQAVVISPDAGIAEILPAENPDRPKVKEIVPTPARKPDPKSHAGVQTYRVQPGDTLSGISMKTFGSYSRYLDIYEANKDQLNSPDDLRLGQELRIPRSDSTPQSSQTEVLVENKEGEVLKEENSAEVLPENLPKFRNPGRTPFLSERRSDEVTHQIQQREVRTYVVQPGDSLERIAVQFFGTVRAVEQLRRANPETTRNPRSLKPGTVLKLVP